MEVSNKFFWIVCALCLGNEVKAKIRGIAGIDFPNYSTIPKTSFKCSKQQFNPGFYADVETRCQVFHYCYNHRRESFLCPPGTIYNQPIMSCDYWYSSECDSAPSFYHMNALNEDKNLIDDFMLATVKTPTNNLFEKMAALYEPKEKSEDFMHIAHDQSLNVGEYRTGFNIEKKGKNYIIDYNKAQYKSELLCSDELLNDSNKINLKDMNEAEFNQNKNSIDGSIFLNDEYETKDLEHSGFGDTVDFSLHNNPENTWIESKDYSYKIDTDGDISSGEMNKIDFNQEQLSDTMNNNPQYEEQFSSLLELTKRFSQTELNPKINRLRRRPKYVIIQSDEIISSSEKENYNVKGTRTYENTFKDKSNASSISYETVSFKHSTDSHEMDKSLIKLPPEKHKRTRRPFILPPDNIQTTLSPLKEYIQAMPHNVFDTYLPDNNVEKPPLRRKPIFIHDMNENANSSDNLYPSTIIPLEASSTDSIYTIDEGTKDITQSYDFSLSTELPIIETTTTILHLSEFSALEDKSLKESEHDLFGNQTFSEENFQKIERDMALNDPQEIIEHELQQDHLNSTENEITAIRTDFVNKYHDVRLNDFELSEISSKNMKESNLPYSEFKDSSTFSPVEPTSIEREYSTNGLNTNLKETLSSEISDKSTLEHKDIPENDQTGNLFSEIHTSLTNETNHDYNEYIKDEILNANTLSPVEYTESIDKQVLFETQYNSQWVDENEFLSLLEMNSGDITDSTSIVYYDFDENDGLEKIDYNEEESEVQDKYEFEAVTENFNTERIPYTEQEQDNLSYPFYIKDDKDENMRVLQANEVSGDIVTHFPLDSESVEHSLNEEFIPQTVISEITTPNIPVHLNPIKIRQNLKENSENSISQTNEDGHNKELLIVTKENLFEIEEGNKVNTLELNPDDSVDQNISQVPINFGLGDSHLKNAVVSEIGNEVMIKEISETNYITEISSLPGTAIEELFKISQIKPTFNEKGIEANVEMKQSIINKDQFQQIPQFVSISTNTPIFEKVLQPQLSSTSIKVPISSKTNLPTPFPLIDVKVPISGKSVHEFQFPTRSKKSLTKTVGKSQFTSLPPLRNMQLLLSRYLSDSGVNDRSLFSSRSGKLFKSEKFAKAITFGKKLLAMKRAKFNILKKYAASFSNEN